MPVSANNPLKAPVSVLEVSIGSRRLGVQIDEVKELIQPAAVSQVPKTHPFTKGVFRLRDRIYPLINLPALFNEDAELSESEKEDCKYVLVKQESHIAGLFVHAIHDIAVLSENDLLADESLTALESAISCGYAQVQNQKLLILHVPQLVQYIKKLNQDII